MDNFSITNFRHLYYKTSNLYVQINIFRITVIKQVIWDRITRLRERLWYTRTPNASYALSFLLNWFSVKYKYLLQVLRVFFLHLAWLKDRFLKKMLLKEKKPTTFFFRKTLGSTNHFILFENDFKFFYFFF